MDHKKVRINVLRDGKRDMDADIALILEKGVDVSGVVIELFGTFPGLDIHPCLFTARSLVLVHKDGTESKIPAFLPGIENYTNIDSFAIHRQTRENCLESLQGMEFCHRLRHLIISYQSVKDLSPLSDLSMTSLSIPDNPITSLAIIRTNTINFLTISIDQLDLLPGCDFSSLETLWIEYGRRTWDCYVEDPRSSRSCKDLTWLEQVIVEDPYDTKRISKAALNHPIISRFIAEYPKCSITMRTGSLGPLRMCYDLLLTPRDAE